MTASTSPAVRAGVLPLLYLGMLAAVQGADPNIASTALLSASSALHMGTLDAIAASINTLMVAATVITTGMMADRWGRKKVLIAALIITIIGDLVVATAATPILFVIGRGIAGIGLGAVFGCSFAYIKVFAEGRKGGLPAALGICAAATGAFALIFTFVGSALVGVDWRVAFLFIPVMAAISLLAGFVLLPGDGARPVDPGPWDALGQVLLAVGIILSLYGISHATNGITDPLTIGPFVLGVIVLGLWVWRESTHSERRFFPIGLFRQPVFLAAIVAGLLYNLTSGVTLLAFSNLFQYSLNLSGLGLSLSQLPYLIVGIPAAFAAGKLLGSGRLSRRMLLVLGAAIITAGAVVFAVTALSRPDTVLAYFPALVLIGMGAIIPSVPYGSMILEEADEKHFGVVSSSRTTIGQYWYSLGLAGATIILDAVTRGVVGSKLGSEAVDQLNTYAATGTAPTIPDVLQTAAHGYVDAFATLMFVLASITVVGAIAVIVLLRKDRPVTSTTTTGAAD